MSIGTIRKQHRKYDALIKKEEIKRAKRKEFQKAMQDLVAKKKKLEVLRKSK
jgi:molybdate-binding protein